jgi:hypothetical protein
VWERISDMDENTERKSDSCVRKSERISKISEKAERNINNLIHSFRNE